LIIADDLTGAADAAAPFAVAGCATAIPLRGAPPAAGVLSVSTNSRDLPPDAAVAAVRAALTDLLTGAGKRPDLVYKKIDSALRGQIRAELIATMDVLGIRRAVVAPALPSEGRTTRGGRQYADGVPLERSAFAGDGTSSNVVELLAGPGTGPPVRLVELDTVRARSADLSAVLAADGIVVVDAETDMDLDLIVRGATDARIELLAGSAGLARALARTISQSSASLSSRTLAASGKPVLVVAGSRHAGTARQIEQLERKGAVVVRTDQQELDGPGGRLDVAMESVERALAAGHHTVLTTAGCKPSPSGSLSVATCLATVVESTPVRAGAGGLVLTGGDVAAAVCARLGATAIWLRGEVRPAIPWGTLTGGALPGMPIVTKAGSFGDDDALVSAVEQLADLDRPKRVG